MCGEALKPAGAEFGGGYGLFRGAGPVGGDLSGGGGVVAQLGDEVADLRRSRAHGTERLGRDAGDVGLAVADCAPANAEPAGELPAELGTGEGSGSALVEV